MPGVSFRLCACTSRVPTNTMMNESESHDARGTLRRDSKKLKKEFTDSALSCLCTKHLVPTIERGRTWRMARRISLRAAAHCRSCLEQRIQMVVSSTTSSVFCRGGGSASVGRVGRADHHARIACSSPPFSRWFGARRAQGGACVCEVCCRSCIGGAREGATSFPLKWQLTRDYSMHAPRSASLENRATSSTSQYRPSLPTFSTRRPRVESPTCSWCRRMRFPGQSLT